MAFFFKLLVKQGVLLLVSVVSLTVQCHPVLWSLGTAKTKRKLVDTSGGGRDLRLA